MKFEDLQNGKKTVIGTIAGIQRKVPEWNSRRKIRNKYWKEYRTCANYTKH